MTEGLQEYLRDQMGGQRAKPSQRLQPPSSPFAPHEFDLRGVFGIGQSGTSIGRDFASIANEAQALTVATIAGKVPVRPFRRPDVMVNIAFPLEEAEIVHSLRLMRTDKPQGVVVVDAGSIDLGEGKAHLRVSRTAGVAGPAAGRPGVDVRWLGYKSHLEASLEGALEETPLEDGFTNPAENLLRQTFEEYPQRAAHWMPGFLRSADPGISGDVLICLSRLPDRLIGALRFEIAAEALRATDVRIRYAGVRALEAWGGSDAIRLLDGFRADRRWLADYAERVLRDLRVPGVADAIPR